MQVRCDAASLGVPCTNCVAFSIECRIPTPKRKKNQAKAKDGSGYVSLHAHLIFPLSARLQLLTPLPHVATSPTTALLMASRGGTQTIALASDQDKSPLTGCRRQHYRTHRQLNRPHIMHRRHNS